MGPPAPPEHLHHTGIGARLLTLRLHVTLTGIDWPAKLMVQKRARTAELLRASRRWGWGRKGPLFRLALKVLMGPVATRATFFTAPVA